MIVCGLYLICFILSLLAVYLLLVNVSNKRSSYYVILFTLISVVCLAYFAYSISLNDGMALVANQFTYFDGTFVLMFFLFCVLDICGIEIRKSLAIPMFLACLFFLGLAFTTGISKLLYTSYEYEVGMGAAHLVMQFGPLHNFFLAFVILNTLAPILIIIYFAFSNRKISYKYISALGLLEIMIVALYFIEHIFGLSFDILPCGYVFMEYVILAIIHRIALYDGSQIVIYNSESRREYGYIIFDNHKTYVGSNDVARYYFPELNELDIDRAVKDEFILEEFVNNLDSTEYTQKAYSRMDRIVVSTIKPYITGSKNRVYGYIVEIRDDTEQQRLIQTLNSMNLDLEIAVDSANRANNAKSDFLASMSHEIRTPINAVLGMNEIAIRECKDENIIPYLNDIKNAGNNLLFLINDILDFSKIEAGKIELVESDYKLINIIKSVHDLISVKASQKDLTLEVIVDTKLPTVLKGDDNRIRQIIINILNNAIKYTQKGKVTMNVTSREDEDGIFNLVVAVSDTGIGIKEENIPFLFDSFSRVDLEKNKNIEGTGLGLAITKRLCEMMNGNIVVDSIYGEGSTFTITIPQVVIDEAPIGDYKEQCREINKGRDIKEHIDASGVSILVVDDNKVNLIVVKGLLKVTKATVVTCTSGKECLDIITKQHFDVILLDHMMPEMDGIETLHKARELENSLCKDSDYIVLTANAISDAKDMYMDEGFDGYISKPINPQELEDVISKYIKG